MFGRRYSCGLYCCIFAVLGGNFTALTQWLVPVLTRAKVEGSSNYVNTSVAIHHHGSYQNFTMDLEVHVLSPLDKLRMNVGYFVRILNSEKWIYNKTYDFCGFLQRPSVDRFGALVIDDLRQHGKVPTGCPIQPERYVFKNVTLNRVKLPPFLPETNFGFTVNCYIGPKNEKIFRSNWYGGLRRVML
uniref:MD-2-related lipid-recognition domain-containing protein n=1 Tax=Anopheles merus TaxID=30066 RepID=A0A182VL27_ANOME